MNITHHDNATTWRELTDQLTPRQIAELEYCEREQVPPGLPDHAQGQLNCARMMARSNLMQAAFSDIDLPADALDEISDWQEWGDSHGRMYTAFRREVDRSAVEVIGVQYDDGSVKRSVAPFIDDEPLTSAQARTLAAALLDAADELDRLGGLECNK